MIPVSSHRAPWADIPRPTPEELKDFWPYADEWLPCVPCLEVASCAATQWSQMVGQYSREIHGEDRYRNCVFDQNGYNPSHECIPYWMQNSHYQKIHSDLT